MSRGEIPLFLQWEAFLKWLLAKTEKFPKRVRFTLTTRIDNLALDILEMIIEARYSSSKGQTLRAMNVKMEKLRILLRLSYELGCLDPGGYEHASRSLEESGRMAGGWRRSLTAPAPEREGSS